MDIEWCFPPRGEVSPERLGTGAQKIIIVPVYHLAVGIIERYVYFQIPTVNRPVSGIQHLTPYLPFGSSNHHLIVDDFYSTIWLFSRLKSYHVQPIVINEFRTAI